MNTFFTILTVVGVPSLISGVCMIIIQKSLKKRDEKQDVLRAQNEMMERQHMAAISRAGRERRDG